MIFIQKCAALSIKNKTNRNPVFKTESIHSIGSVIQVLSFEKEARKGNVFFLMQTAIFADSGLRRNDGIRNDGI